MKMVDGALLHITAPSGSLTPPLWAGPLIATVIGCGLRPGATPGSMTSRGALRHSTMAVGLWFAGRGDGYLAVPQQSSVSPTSVRSTPLRSSRGLAEAALPLASRSVVGPRWAGSHWVRVKAMSTGIT